MQTKNITDQLKLVSDKARPQQTVSDTSSKEVAALRAKVQSLEKNIPTQEAEVSKNEGLLTASNSGDTTLLEAEDLSKQQMKALASVTEGLKQQINASRTEIQYSELLAKASEYETRAHENGDAYTAVLKNIAPDIKQEMQDDEQHRGLIKKQFAHQAKVGREAMEFWGNEKEFWTDELAAGPTDLANKDKLVTLYDQVFTLETQINSLFGSGSKEEKDGLKSKLASVKEEVSAIRSGASA